MQHVQTRTASLLAAAALLFGASPALAASRPDRAPSAAATPQPRPPVGQTARGALAVIPTRTRVVTMRG
jgi:hypothetical protein